MEMGNKAIFITGKNVQDHEFIYPYYRLKEEGYEITLAILGGEPTTGVLGTNIPCDKDYQLSKDVKIIGTTWAELSSHLADDLLIIPGGAKAMEYLRQNEAILEFISHFRGRIGCICHGAQLLISAKRVKGLKISGYYSIKDDIENAGATYSKEVVEDANIVTCAHYKDLGQWMKKILK